MTNRQTWEQLVKYGLDTSSLDVLQSVVAGDIPLPDGVALDVVNFFTAGRSAAELEWRKLGPFHIEEMLKKKIVFIGYEWFTFRIPGGVYTPDFNYLLEDGQWAHVEVKATKLQKNYRDARTHLRAAASLNPWFWFFEARMEWLERQDRRKRRAVSGEWKVERIHPDLAVLASLQANIDNLDGRGGNGHDTSAKSTKGT